jgi:chromosome segregation ATPase
MNVCHGSGIRQASAAVSLLVALALGLCGLCAFQWVRETRLRQRVEALEGEKLKVAEEKATAESQGQRFQQEIQRIEAERTELFRTVEKHNDQVGTLKAEAAAAKQEVERLAKQAAAFKEALDRVNGNTERANEQISKLNTDLRRVAEERNKAVERFNELSARRDEELKRYNDLVAQWNVQQEALKKAAGK